MAVTINGTTGITTPDLDSTADITANSVPVGKGAGSVATNTAIGIGALNSNTSGQDQVALGYLAGNATTTGSQNTFLGTQAGAFNTTGQSNTMVGWRVGYNSTGSYNTYVGPRTASASGAREMTSGSYNTILGGYTGNAEGLDIRTSNGYVVLSDGNGYPRQWTDNSNVTYRFGNSNAASWSKSVTGVVTAASSGSAKKLCITGPTGALNIRVMAIQGAENNSGCVAGNICMAYGNNTTGTLTKSVIGNISDITIAYDNGGSPIYTINCTVTYSGAAPTLYYVIEGLSTYNLTPQ